ncbi:uncharacterized protein RCC_06582 [Ramularia collo-cygni]|uniref:Uncharacterized protein n=1 Tax=Ramularia collo-cygni TaxID=112498 RepID=A0A2D3VD66_9PEZI|nr:uncharacterized protein RCC_06582 [Ramularia collo-cygni]CZT20724.1 uncharacterized protein RCC_06582 [Ramularia collo-cygni]
MELPAETSVDGEKIGYIHDEKAAPVRDIFATTSSPLVLSALGLLAASVDQETEQGSTAQRSNACRDVM